MHKPLSTLERYALMEPVSTTMTLKLTRKQKLKHWADLIRTYPRQITMLHEVEYLDRYRLSRARATHSIFDVAAKDPMLSAAGLKDDTAWEGSKFFELSKHELHYLSCDCFGAITNVAMAERVDHLASQA